MFQINGPLFFGAANRLDNLLDQFRDAAAVFILRMRLVPIIDASGVHALEDAARPLPAPRHRAGRFRPAGAAAPGDRADAPAPREGELYFAADLTPPCESPIDYSGTSPHDWISARAKHIRKIESTRDRSCCW